MSCNIKHVVRPGFWGSGAAIDATCVKCNKPSEFMSTEDLCMRHWCEWFTYKWPNQEKEIKNMIRRLRYKDKKNGITYCKHCKSWHEEAHKQQI